MRPKPRRILLYIIITLVILALPILLPRACGPVLHSARASDAHGVTAQTAHYQNDLAQIDPEAPHDWTKYRDEYVVMARGQTRRATSGLTRKWSRRATRFALRCAAGRAALRSVSRIWDYGRVRVHRSCLSGRRSCGTRRPCDAALTHAPPQRQDWRLPHIVACTRDALAASRAEAETQIAIAPVQGRALGVAFLSNICRIAAACNG